jgi:hypothetical protein
LPKVLERALEASAARRAKRSAQAVNAGQEGRSERQARGHWETPTGGGLPVRSLRSPIEWNHPIAKGRQRPGRRRRHQQRDSLLANRCQQVGQRLLLGRGKTGFGLINQYQPRTNRQRPGKLKQPLFRRRQLSRQLLPLAIESDKFERIGCPVSST